MIHVFIMSKRTKKVNHFKSRFIVIIESENINKIKPITIETMQWTRTHTFRCFYFVSVCRFVWRQKCSSVYVSTHFAGKCKRFHTNTCKHQQCIGIRHTHTHACVHGVHSIQSNAFGLRLEEGWVEDKQKHHLKMKNQRFLVHLFSAHGIALVALVHRGWRAHRNIPKLNAFRYGCPPKKKKDNQTENIPQEHNQCWMFCWYHFDERNVILEYIDTKQRSISNRTHTKHKQIVK